MFVTNGILFNHESPRRTPTFVTRKTTQAIARIVHGSKEPLVLETCPVNEIGDMHGIMPELFL